MRYGHDGSLITAAYIGKVEEIYTGSGDFYEMHTLNTSFIAMYIVTTNFIWHYPLIL